MSHDKIIQRFVEAKMAWFLQQMHFRSCLLLLTLFDRLRVGFSLGGTLFSNAKQYFRKF